MVVTNTEFPFYKFTLYYKTSIYRGTFLFSPRKNIYTLIVSTNYDNVPNSSCHLHEILFLRGGFVIVF